ncbi:MAG: SseB family protein [Ruminococcus sp.]|nr:SseB family protein [Ruminococcus sp.]
MAENQNSNEVRNDELLEAIKEMRADFNTQTQSKVINLTLRSTFLVPAIINRNTELVADKDNHLKFQDKPQAKFMLVKHEKNGTFFPAFTDVDELAKLKNENGYQGVKMKFADLATLTERTPSVAGFVINPMSTNLPFTKEMLDSIKKTLQEAKQKREAEKAQEQADAQGITMTSAEAEATDES